MKPHVPLMQQLRNLREASASDESLRFLVNTAEGLRVLTLSEALKLIPNPDRIAVPAVPAEVQASEREVQEDLIRQLSEQLELHQSQLHNLHERLAQFPLSDEAAEIQEFVPDESVAIGLGALEGGAKDQENVAVGIEAGYKLEGYGNTLIGPHAGKLGDGEMIDVTAVGSGALACTYGDLRNVTALGSNTRHTGNNQVILGDHMADVYSHTAMHRRADRRDMRDVDLCELGMDFVLNVDPIQFRLDPREAYIDWSTRPVEPEPLRARPVPPEGDKDAPGYQPQLMAYLADKTSWEREEKKYEQQLAQYHLALGQWMEDNKLARIYNDGTHASRRLHVGFDGAQLLRALETFSTDYAFVQDHAVNGGEEVLTAADGALVPILWNAFRQMHKFVHSPEFIDQVASALLSRHADTLSALQAPAPAESDLPAED